MKSKRYNQTRLLPEQELRVHRDYLAHCFRWDLVPHFFGKRITANEWSILDVGCGEGHLLQVLWRNRVKPALYVGVDVDPVAIKKAINMPQPRQFSTDWYQDDFVQPHVVQYLVNTYGYFDLVTNFEVVEHMPREDTYQFVANLNVALKPGGYLAISTPTKFNPTDEVTCNNHLHEFTHAEFIALIMSAGFEIIRLYGTMMYTKYFDRVLVNAQDERLREVVSILREYFSSNILSALFGPVYPELSRSCIIIGRKLQ